MKDFIGIAHWLLTRRCNLKCDYCGIIKSRPDSPKEYPTMKYYMENEASTETVIDGLTKLKNHNPEIFNIFFGGEPTLRKDLPEIIKFCNDNDIYYTIVTNNTDELQPLIKKLVKKVGHLKGLTTSIDPVFDLKVVSDKDRFYKSDNGLKNFIKHKEYVTDLCSIVTISNENVPYIYDHIRKLTDYGITTNLTFVDIAKNPYYDFSNVCQPWELVERSPELANQFKKIYEDKTLDMHMKDILLPAMFNSLPSNIDCKFGEHLHHIVVDADGSLRLCLRIRGVWTPKYIKVTDMFIDGRVSPVVKQCMGTDIVNYCELCNHNCSLMTPTGEKGKDIRHSYKHIKEGS